MNEEIKNNGRQVAVEAHRAVNHIYDVNLNLPYECHLTMVAQAGEQFLHLLPNDSMIVADVFAALWNHDRIEDTRATYTTLVNEIGQRAADIVFAVTNEKGKTRKDRANDKYYRGIRETEYAVFVKLCDRIANVTFGKLFDGKLDMYRKEQKNFEIGLSRDAVTSSSIVTSDWVRYFPMVEHLRKLLA